MVTWGVTGAGGRVVGSRSRVEDDDSAVASSVPESSPVDSGEPCAAAEGGARPDRELPPITVAPTGPGLAQAVNAAAAALTTTGPRRSHPAFRATPPAMTLGDRTRVPDSLTARVSDVDVSLVLPPDRTSVLLAAPLAYYLPAEIRTREECTPRLLVRGEPRVTFDDVERGVRSVLRRVFHLDCLVRREPRFSGRPDENVDAGVDLLDRLDLDSARLRSLAAEDRLDRYLDAWEPRFDDALPEWHLATTVDPTAEAVESLSSLLDRLSAIVLPDSEPRRYPDLLDRTLGDAYRTRGRSEGADVVAPNGRPARSQGWLAPGRPVEAFKPTLSAFEHRRRYRRRRSTQRTVAVVLGDGRMREEYEEVARAYREQSTGATVDVVESPTRADLLSVLEGEHDVLHYVGHCDDEGLRCTDGHLGAEDVTPCRTPAFVLNACGSYDQGLALVERGAVAGAVTFADVLDRHAARVGTALARLLADGFSVQRALQIARRRILMGQDYAAVGDGTYAPWPEKRPPGVLWVEPVGDEHGRANENESANKDGRVNENGSAKGNGRIDENERIDEGETAGAQSEQISTSQEPSEGATVESDNRARWRDFVPADAYDVTYDALTIRRTGDRHPVPFDDRSILNGEAVSKTLSRDELATVLEWGSFPVVWEEDLYWSADVRKSFRPRSV